MHTAPDSLFSLTRFPLRALQRWLAFWFLPCLLGSLAPGADQERLENPSIGEMWRWNQMMSLRHYQIKAGCEDQNGVLWFVYAEGLIAYDGRTIVEHPIPETAFQNTLDVVAASDGRIFIVLINKLVIWENGSVEVFEEVSPSGFSRDVLVEYKDSILLVDSIRGLFQLKGSRLTRVPTALRQPVSLLLDKQNHLWVVDHGAQQICVFRILDTAGEIEVELLHSFPCTPDNTFKPRLFEDSRGRVWVIDPDEEDRCYRYDNYEKEFAIAGLKAAALWAELVEVVEDEAGTIYFAVRRRLGSYDGKQLSQFDITDLPIPSSLLYFRSLSSRKLLLGGVNLAPNLIDLSPDHWKTYPGLNFQCEDRDGNYWYLSHDRKVIVQQASEWIAFGPSQDVIDTPNRLIAGRDGSIWASGSHQGAAAISYYFADKWHRFSFPEACQTFSHLAALETRNGSFVFGCGTPDVSLGGCRGGGVVFKKNGAAYAGTYFPPPAFLGRTATLVERVDDGLYMGAGAIAKGFSKEEFTATELDVFNNQWIDHMMVDADNNLWAACLGIGIYQFDGSTWKFYGPSSGLTNPFVIYLLEDSVRDGIIVLTEEGFYFYDGMLWAPWDFQSTIRFKRENHTLAQSSDGALWINFASRGWFLEGESVMGEDTRFKTIRYMPDGNPPETYAYTSRDEFPEGSQIYIQFDAIDYWDDTPKEDIVYSWRLDDGPWSEYSSEFKTVLFNTPAGKHTLQVRSRDKAANWDPTPAMLEFAVIPPLWKHPAFVVGVVGIVLLVAFLVYALFRVRVKAALALDDFKLDFFTNISHELRNPLAVILAPVERLLAEEAVPEKRRTLQIVLRNARKMQGMVDQLLQFRKIEKGRWVVAPAGGEIVSFMQDELRILEPLWQAKNQEFSFSIQPPSFQCSFDPMVIQTIVTNLVSNAVKYSAEGTRIRMNADVASRDGVHELTISIEDEGVSIPAHEKENILMPFYRVKGKGHEVGSGLGLALVNQLVRLCGGTILIESPLHEDDKGSRFTVRLPLDHYHEPEVVTPNAAPAQGRPERPSLLMVEDNADFRHVLAQELSLHYDIFEAENGRSGFAEARRKNPDLIISDVMMPEMGGFELCEKLKSNPDTSHIPIILLTAKAADEHRIKGLRLGADAYIPKPLNVGHLQARIENLLKTRADLRKRFTEELLIEASDITVTPTDEMILKKAIQIVDEKMIEEGFDVKQFSKSMGMSKSSLVRKLKAITGLTPLQFIQNMRLKRAAAILGRGGVSVSDAAVRVGIYNMSYFSKLFRAEFGVVPSAYGSSRQMQNGKPVEASKSGD